MLMKKYYYCPLWLLLLCVFVRARAFCGMCVLFVNERERERERARERDWGMQRTTHGEGADKHTTIIKQRGRGCVGREKEIGVDGVALRF